MTVISIFNDTKNDLMLHSRSQEGSEGSKIPQYKTSDFFFPDGRDVLIKIWPTMIMAIEAPIDACPSCGCRGLH